MEAAIPSWKLCFPACFILKVCIAKVSLCHKKNGGPNQKKGPPPPASKVGYDTPSLKLRIRTSYHAVPLSSQS